MALWLYATMDGVGSAREVDRLCSSHDAYRCLRGGVSVHYHTPTSSTRTRMARNGWSLRHPLLGRDIAEPRVGRTIVSTHAPIAGRSRTRVDPDQAGFFSTFLLLPRQFRLLHTN